MGISVKRSDIKLELDYDSILSEFAPSAMNAVKKKAPERYGTYKQDITFTIVGSTIIVYVQAPQYRIAHILEFGSVNQRSQPHFMPGYNEVEKKYIEKMKNVDIKEK